MDQQIKESLKIYLKEFYKSSPITSHQIGIGLGLSILNTNWLKFHPRLFGSPNFQFYRGITNFLITGDSLGEALSSSLGLAFNSSLEFHLQNISRQSPHRYKWLYKISSFFSKLIKNHYLRAQVISAIVILIFELTLFRSKSSLIGSSPAWLSSITEFLKANAISTVELAKLSMFLTPISLFNVLDASMKWLWTFMNSHRQIKVGDYKMHPIWIPFISAFIFGRDGWMNNLKGFLSAIVVAEIMNLRNVHGEPIVESGLVEIYRLASESARSIYTLLNT